MGRKVAFPSRNVGYVTVQNYNPDKTVTERMVAKLIDGGKSWKPVEMGRGVNKIPIVPDGDQYVALLEGWRS